MFIWSWSVPATIKSASRDDLPSVFRASDVFAIASECEVQSIPTLQAIATGLPVVAVDAAALPELVTDGVTGFLVPADDPGAMGSAVESILDDPDRAAAMGRAGLETSRLHGNVATFDAHERLYESVISAHSSSTQVPQPRLWSRVLPMLGR
jgi:glycosyltransferase involved in cell wall biosynthesis